MARFCIGLLVLLILKNLYAGHYVLSALIFVLFALIGADMLAVRRGQALPVPVPVVLSVLVLVVVATTYFLGPLGAVWAFPAIVGSNLVEARRWGFVLGWVLTICTPVVVLVQGEPFYALRLFAALGTTAAYMWFTVSRTDELQRRLLSASTRDPLTGCYNRRVLNWTARELRGGRSALLLIDIDHFKKVNDDFGHARGDEVLKIVASLIRGELREDDKLFRIGGEEFLVLLQGGASALGNHVAERIRARVEAATILPSRKVTVSIGVAELSGGGRLAASMRQADQMLYAAKAQGRNRVGERGEVTRRRHMV